MGGSGQAHGREMQVTSFTISLQNRKVAENRKSGRFELTLPVEKFSRGANDLSRYK